MASRTRTKLANAEIQVAGDQWPIFLYANYTYDPEDTWNGLLCSGLLVGVSPFDIQWYVFILINFPDKGIQTYFHVSEFCRSGT